SIAGSARRILPPRAPGPRAGYPGHEILPIVTAGYSIAGSARRILPPRAPGPRAGYPGHEILPIVTAG
ncbi:hypothetical protein, partial [Hymenobacter coccineus]|uniref:hypothetical protein n=1 Tax=Hymenobacter coccineus TaxID=1908235 RepID=UPI001955B6AC